MTPNSVPLVLADSFPPFVALVSFVSCTTSVVSAELPALRYLPNHFHVHIGRLQPDAQAKVFSRPAVGLFGLVVGVLCFI